ncbi:hypothetical protein DICA1_A04588 [Diutina catenulata]
MELIGQKVNVPGTRGHGILKYYGPIADKQGLFGGLELVGPIAALRGKNSGMVDGNRYFEVDQPMTGLFLPWDRLRSSNPSLPALNPNGSIAESQISLPKRGSPGGATPSSGIPAPKPTRSRLSSGSSLGLKGAGASTTGAGAKPGAAPASALSSTPSSAPSSGSRPRSRQLSDSRPPSRRSPALRPPSEARASPTIAEHELYAAEIAELKGKCAATERQLADKEAILGELRATVDELHPLLEQYEAQVAEANARADRTKAEFERAREEWRSSVEAMTASHQENEEFYVREIEALKRGGEGDGSGDGQGDGGENGGEMEERVREMEERVREEEARVREVEERARAAEERAREEEARATAAEERLREEEARAAEYQHTAEAHQRTIDTHQRTIDDHQRTIATHKETLDARAADSELAARVAELERQVEEARRETEEAREEARRQTEAAQNLAQNSAQDNTHNESEPGTGLNGRPSSELVELKEKNRSLKQLLAEGGSDPDKLDDLEGKIKSLTRENIAIKEAMAEADQSTLVEQLQKQMAKLAKENKMFKEEKELGGLSGAMDSTDSLAKNKQLADENNQQEKAILELRAKVEELEGAVEREKEEKEAEKAARAKAEEARESAEKEAREKAEKEARESAEKEAKQLAEKETKEQAAQLAELRAKASADDTLIAQLQSQVEAIMVDKAALETKLKARADDTPGSPRDSDQVSRLEAQIEELRHELTMRPTFDELSEVQHSLDELEEVHKTELQDKREEISRLSSQLTAERTRSRAYSSMAPPSRESMAAASMVGPSASRGSSPSLGRASTIPEGLEESVVAETSQLMDSLPIFTPEPSDPAAGRSDWCGLCERDGHSSINCPYENDIF